MSISKMFFKTSIAITNAIFDLYFIIENFAIKFVIIFTDFKFHIVVRSVIGTGIDAVGDIDIIIDSITKNGEDFYHIWAKRAYNDSLWYIRELDETFYLDYLDDLPFSVYSTVYGHDEKRTKKDTIDESVIKRIIRKLL